MSNLPSILGLLLFLLSGRLFLGTFKAKPEGWQIRCAIYLTVSILSFVVILLTLGPAEL